MAKHDPQKDVEVLDRLERCAQESPQFTDDEAKIVKLLIDAYKGWMALGKMGVFLIKVLTGITILAVASGHAKGWVLAWLK